ncbi:hypothetical protein PACTADRAFT_50981 [Pachysolen tannophilus NRRL Y-2460]|uniref:U3 small nucleolar RNA-associated protein 15 C-terminal domain-containing protein n=1 Tax=Pachysolen tannophilus NRRL Y-2460 TaxID=669874 RepID=A0A1E4TQU9_PACTA|nr:hypothetical protein PACTADRAFT_50981 [Pachysolen tannophilus NRRL Y-2460]
MSSSKKRVVQVRNATLPAQTTPEQRYWRGFTNTQLVKEHNSITHIHFNPISPYDFAITSSTRVQVFSSKTRQVAKTFSRFKDVVYSAEFRNDGKLLVAGDQTGLVQVFDALQPRTLLVSINASSHPTHVTKFHPTNLTNLLTGSDDRVARLYDISNSAAPINVFGNHEDYIRSANFIPGSNLVATGCYDGYVRVFDPRVNNTNNDPILKFNQDFPVEDILSLNSTNLISCGGRSIKIWDLTAGKQLRDMTNFTKTVTCLSDAGERGILAGSLDGHVKVFDSSSSNWEVKFGWKFGGGVLGCGVSPNHKHFVVGLSSGLLAIRTRKTEPRVKQGVKTSTKSGAFQKMMRGAEYHGEYEHHIVNDKLKTTQTKKLKPFEKSLNAFKWSEALDNAFIPGMSRELTITVLEELKNRGKIRVALADRDETKLEPLLTWSLKAIEDVRSVNIVSDYIGVVLEMYGSVIEKSPILEELVIAFSKKIQQEIEKAKESQQIEGMLQLLST